MVELSEDQARSLIISGAAGYWGLHSKTIVLEHDEQIVVRLRGKWFLALSHEMKVEYVGKAGCWGGKEKGAFMIKIECPELEKMAKEEMQERGIPFTN